MSRCLNLFYQEFRNGHEAIVQGIGCLRLRASGLLAESGHIFSPLVCTEIVSSVSEVRQPRGDPSRDVYSNSACSSGGQGPNALVH